MEHRVPSVAPISCPLTATTAESPVLLHSSCRRRGSRAGWRRSGGGAAAAGAGLRRAACGGRPAFPGSASCRRSPAAGPTGWPGSPAELGPTQLRAAPRLPRHRPGDGPWAPLSRRGLRSRWPAARGARAHTPTHGHARARTHRHTDTRARTHTDTRTHTRERARPPTRARPRSASIPAAPQSLRSPGRPPARCAPSSRAPRPLGLHRPLPGGGERAARGSPALGECLAAPAPRVSDWARRSPPSLSPASFPVHSLARSLPTPGGTRCAAAAGAAASFTL